MASPLKLLTLGLALLGAATANHRSYDNYDKNDRYEEDEKNILPKPPGKYDVGTTSFELVDYGRNDPLAPSPQPRDLMIQAFYPARGSRRYPLTPEFTPALANWYAEQFPLLNKDVLLSIKTRARMGAPLAKDDPPVLIFSPGYTSFTRAYSAIASYLASKGYIVLGIEHPYHNSLVEYPDGRVTPVMEGNFTEVVMSTDLGVEVRSKDVSFVLDQLRNGSVTNLIPSLKDRLDTSKVGVFGHSYGGATATSALLNDTRVACAANLDGFITPVAEALGTDKPYLLMSPPNSTIFRQESWAPFLDRSTGFRRHLAVEGTQHSSFSDVPLVLDILGVKNATARTAVEAGTISGARIQDIMGAYMDAFFSSCLQNKNETLLAGPSPRYKEVRFLRSEDGA